MRSSLKEKYLIKIKISLLLGLLSLKEAIRNYFLLKLKSYLQLIRLLINGKFVQSANDLIVIASESSSTTSTFRWPRLEFYAFYDPFSFEVELKDRFANRLNQVEVDKYYKDNKTVQMQISQPKIKPKLTFEKVNNLGVQLNNVSLSPDDLEDVFTDAEITLTFLLDSVTIHKMLLKILGVGFRKRLDLFTNDIAEFRKDYSKEF